ncbi:DEAD/DEAH box helicase [Belnapia rosea]|uniref:DEAD/DEAH box helicase n=1 Tax=Belnapia rosea TaxID=938405 RepID=A0A1G7ATH9_9PROT|nr:DEAD/DEAH box helicase [Belnapia rosea]SDE18091.1 protein of unknown function [Belnapia rosea]
MEIEKSLQVDAIRTRAQMQDRLVDVASADAYMRDPALQERVRQVWRGEDRGGGSASELFVEGIFPAADSGASIDDLVRDGSFAPALRKQLAGVDGSMTGRPLYQHQRDAIELAQRPGPSRPVVVVRAGTGMGKTEAFLLPLLNDLHSRPRTGRAEGVRAIVLYPMNALVNDQVERLHGWMKGQNACRLFHFTSETPEDPRTADKVNYPPFDRSRVRTRKEARENPPDVLVTNYSMLEYMLIRPQDAPFFGRDLSVIVLDEMHLYSGTLAAEIALLLRRVLLRCGLRHEDVMWLGASATLGGDLKEFSAALFSRSAADVHVLEGQKTRPQLKETVAPAAAPTPVDVPDILPTTPFLDEGGLVEDPGLAARVAEEGRALAGPGALDAAAHQTRPANALAEILARAPLMHRLQDELWRASTGGDIVPLGRLSSALWGRSDTETRGATERLLRLGARARWSANELPLFPHKIHFLVRSPVAPMTCVNPDCTHASSYRLPGAGPVLSSRHEVCPACSTQTLPLARCRSCGDWFMAAFYNSGDNRFRPARDWREDDDRLEDDDDEAASTVRFLRPADPADPAWEPYQLADGRRETLMPHAKLRTHQACPTCEDGKFALVQLGDTAGLGMAAETMLASMPPWAGADRAWRPADGRRLIAFNDSRPSAARLGPTLTATHEIQMGRAMIADCLQGASLSDAKLARLRKHERRLLEELEETEGSERTIIEQELAACRADMRGASAGGTMRFWSTQLKAHPLTAQFFDREKGQFHKSVDWTQGEWETNRDNVRQRVDTILAREFAVAVPSILSLETTGLAEVVFPGLEELSFPDRLAGLMPNEAACEALAGAWPGVLAGLCDTVRMNRCVTFGDGEMDRSASYYPVGVWMSLAAPGPSMSSFLPGRPGETRRTRFATAVLRAAGIEPDAAAALALPLLEAAFAQLAGCARDSALPWLEFGERGVGRSVVDAFRVRFFELGLRAPQEVHRCPRTGAVWPRAVLGCAPIRGSQGGLSKVGQDELDRHPRLARARHAYRNDQAFRIGLWADEHSAQLSPEENRRLQELFSKGIRNILSATTTMEVGIDIGGLCGVLMANMPPGLANYLQRGGRAGRRTDGASIVCTFARRRPYDQAAFDDFQSFFRRELRRANVMLEREGIARRHLQAMLLGEFFQAIRPLDAKAGAMDAFGKIGAFCGVPRPPYLEEGAIGPVEIQPATPIPIGMRRPEPWWDRGAEPDLASEFVHFVEHLAAEGGEIRRRAALLAAGTGFERQAADWRTFADGVVERFSVSVGEWKADFRRVVDQWRAEGASGTSSAKFRMNALARQARELREATVVEELGNRKFLPRYGFPIGLNSLVVNVGKEGANRFKLQRDGTVAVAEYVPGSVVIVGGQFVRSQGVQRAWGSDQDDMVGVTLWRHQCDDGHSKCLTVLEAPDDRCGVDGCSARMRKWPERLLVPRYGYATAASDAPSWFGQRQRVGAVELIINHAAGRSTMSEHDYGGLPGLDASFLENVELVAANAGRGDLGFALCTACGYADSEEMAKGEGAKKLPSGFERHVPLYRASGKPCSGAIGQASVLRNVTFAARQFTDLVRFEFTDVSGTDPVSLTTLGHALAQAGAEMLELDQREIRMAVDPIATGRWVVRVFDAVGHGGGHMAEMFRRSKEWLAATHRVLRRSDAHHEICRTACITCVLSSVSQDDARDGMLDRRAALRVLEGAGSPRLYSLRAEAVAPQPSGPAQPDMLAALQRRKGAAVSRRR